MKEITFLVTGFSCLLRNIFFGKITSHTDSHSTYGYYTFSLIWNVISCTQWILDRRWGEQGDNSEWFTHWSRGAVHEARTGTDQSGGCWTETSTCLLVSKQLVFVMEELLSGNRTTLHHRVRIQQTLGNFGLPYFASWMNYKLIHQRECLHPPNSRQMMIHSYVRHQWFSLPTHCNMTETVLTHALHPLEAQHTLAK